MNNKSVIVGSDAHLAYEYGRSYLKMPSFENPEEFKKSLSAAEFVTRESPLWVHLVTKWMMLKKRRK